MTYDRNADFADLIDKIDSHCFTGDTLFNEMNLERLKRHLGRWDRAVKQQEQINKEIMEENKKNGIEPEVVHYYHVIFDDNTTTYFDSKRKFTHPHAVLMMCKSLNLGGLFVDIKSFNEITKQEYLDNAW
jgi:hypothetical protein